MSFDLCFWKRGTETKTAMLKETYAALCEDKCYVSMAHFKVDDLLDDIKKKLKDWNDENNKYTLEVSTVKDKFREAVFISCAYSCASEVTSLCIELALKHDVMLYDPQRVAVWNNKRPFKNDRI